MAGSIICLRRVIHQVVDKFIVELRAPVGSEGVSLEVSQESARLAGGKRTL